MTQLADTQWVRIERLFDAPIDRVWALWTTDAHFQNWYGPQGMQVEVSVMEVREGGRRRFSMSMPGRDMTMHFIGEFKEVTAPTRLVYTESLCDEAGQILSPASQGMPADHPEVTEIVVELSEQNGQTHMVLTHIGVPAESGAAHGWSQAMDKLAAQLSA